MIFDRYMLIPLPISFEFAARPSMSSEDESCVMNFCEVLPWLN